MIEKVNRGFKFYNPEIIEPEGCCNEECKEAEPCDTLNNWTRTIGKIMT
jgi:hypothetical protein